MRLNRTAILLLMLVLLSSKLTIAAVDEGGFGDEGGDVSSGELSSEQYNDPASYENGAIVQNPNFKTADVPVERVGDLLPHLPEQRWKELSKDQVLENKDQFQNKDLNLLNPEVKNELVKELSNQQQTPNVETQPDTKFQDKGDHIEFNKLQKFATPTFQFTNAEDIKVYKNGCWEIEKASIIDFFGVANAEVSGFDGCMDKNYHITYADSIRAGCFDAREVRDADIEINSDLKLKTKPNTFFDIFYGFRNQMRYQSIDQNNQLIFNPGSCSIPLYQITGINLTIAQAKATESIQANNQATVTLSRDFGVECVEFSPTGTYTYTPEDIRDAFALRASREQHKVCIRKDQKQTVSQCPQCSNVDFINKLIDIDGQIEYLRLQYNDEIQPINILSSGLSLYYETLAPSKSTLHLNDKFHKVNKVEANNPVADDTLQITNWLEFKQYRDQRDAFIRREVLDYSIPLATIYKSPAFEDIEVGTDLISAGNYLFYFPDSEKSNEFFRTLIQRSDLSYPVQN